MHVDVKKLAAIPDGEGHRTRGRGYPGQHARRRVGCRFIHSTLDDRSRLVYSEAHHDEVLNDERAVTAAGFWARAAARFASCGVARIERVLTDNGSCYRSSQWRQARTRTAHKRTRPYRPQTNGKVERFHRILLKILLEERAHIRHRNSETRRQHAYTGFIHYYFIHYYNHAPIPPSPQMGHPSLNPQRQHPQEHN